MRFDAAAMRDLHQAVGIRAVRRAHYQDQVHVLGHLLDRFLAVLRGIANVVTCGPLDRRELLAQARHDFLRIIEAQSRLRKERQLLGIIDFQRVHGLHGVHHDGAVRGFSRRSHNLLLVSVPDENNGALFTREFQRLEVNFGDQRAGRINHFERAGLSFIAHRRRNAVGAENEHRTVRNFLDGFDKNRAAAPQLFHNVGVMDDFVMHIDRGAIGLQRQLDDVHGAHHARAKPAWPYP